MTTIFVALRAVAFASGFVFLWYWIALSVRVFDRRFGIALPEWTRGPGILAMTMGAALALACIAVFVLRGRGTPALFDAPRRFVATGPYRYVRNPMYIGAMLVFAGFGLYLRSPSIVLFAVAWLPVVHALVVGFEEPDLARRFGASYEDYCNAVPRWLPHFPKARVPHT